MSDKGKQKFRRFIILVGIVFLGCSVGSFLLGKFFDRLLGIEPYGSVVSLVISYIVAWIVVLKIRAEIIKS